ARRDLVDRRGDRLHGAFPPGRRVYFAARGLSARAYSGGRTRRSSRQRHVVGSLTSSRNPSSRLAATAGQGSLESGFRTVVGSSGPRPGAQVGTAWGEARGHPPPPGGTGARQGHRVDGVPTAQPRGV